MDAKSPVRVQRTYTLRAMMGERDQTVLDFEGSWWMYPGPKDRAIHEHLGISATRYYQVLRRLMDDTDAEEHAPLTIHRLRRLREDGRRMRAQRRLGDGLPPR